MKYESKNRLCDFEFHDAEAKLTEYNDGVLCLSVTCLNIHKDAVQNKETEYDLELGNTMIRFEKPKIESVNRSNHEAERMEVPHTSFLQNWSNGGDILSLVSFDHHLHLLIDFRDGFFEAEIAYENVTVSWRDYVGLAWYEQHRLYKENFFKK